jgi:F-type H+-transporting ATPase subunit delta
MSSSTIAHRYALALLEIGIERKNFEQIGRELDRVVNLFEFDDVRRLFQNPKFGAAVRKSVLTELLQQIKISPICRNFLFFLVDRSRIGALSHIVDAYHGLADDRAGRMRAKVTVAQRLGEPEVARLRTVLQKATGHRVVIEQHEDPSIIGGIITQIGGKVYDGSVRSQIETFRALMRQDRA